MSGVKRWGVGALLALVATAGWAQDEDVRDPWQGFNRSIFNFNDTIDGYVLRPVAKGYTVITPDRVEAGVSNFFSNLLEVRNIINDVLQWKWKQAGNDTGRFLVNSTVGIVGIFDVARHIHLPKGEGEDFGQTLATWGVNSGPYLVLPFFGPSTLRDGSVLPLEWYVDPARYADSVRVRNSLSALDIINTRANLLNSEAFISGDEYIFVREAYLQRRDYLINDGEVEDDFGDFGEDDF